LRAVDLLLPEGSYWRFVGWLMLGLSVYLSYGYTRSAVGQKLGRPRLTPIGLKFSAVCFILVAVGLFVIPHDVAPRELFSEAFNSSAEQHNQTLYGLLIIIRWTSRRAASASRWAPSKQSEESV
jgi:hypothetical protein